MTRLLLASSSPYRRQILDKLGLTYEWQAPDIDETPKPGEQPEDLVRRLAEQKARALAEAFPSHLIIGSDQVAVLHGRVLGKPGNVERARAQLHAASGETMHFFTGLCLLNGLTGRTQTRCEHYQVSFRELTPHQIDRYLEIDRPFDCAGSFKAEGLGISLFRKMEGEDPNILIGLPLIALIDMLNKEGIEVPN